MAEPGDPDTPDDHDDLIGFASPASLQGRVRAPEPEPEPVPAPEPDLFGEPARAAAPEEPEPPMTPTMAPVTPASRPVDAASIFEPSLEFSTRNKPRDPEPLPGGGMGLYAVYALILFAVPTVGVSALIGLLAVTGRAGPDDALSRSHFV